MEKNKLGKQPWLVPEAVEFLDRIIKPEFVILEFGSGSSTLWFSQRAERVVSFEGNKKWYRKIHRFLSRRNVSNVVLFFSYYPKPERLKPEKFDLILVDGLYRNGIIRMSVKSLKPTGYFVLDNADRSKYGKGKEILDKSLANKKSFKKGKWITTVWFN